MSNAVNAKKIYFRFDVDTHKCAKIGMPRLLDLAKSRGVPFTFFVNCGRSISFYQSLKAMIIKPKSRPADSHPQLSARRKFGNLEYLRCAALNPLIIRYAEDVILRAKTEGHEIGLHGGRNHELWGRFVNDWTDARLRAEIQWGVDHLKDLGITPVSFASPCAEGGERVRQMLNEFEGMQFISDDLNPDHAFPAKHSVGVLDVPTALCGQGGVAYIEQLVAKGLSADEIVRCFESQMKDLNVGVFYDHPYFAGDEAFPIMERLVDCAIKNGFEVTTLTEIGRYYEKENHLSRQRA